MKQSDEKQSWFSEAAQLFYFYLCIICSFFPSYLFGLLARLESPDVCWTALAAAPKKDKQKGGKKLRRQFKLVRLLTPSNPPAPSFITFLKIGDWSDSRTHKHAEMCGDHEAAFQFSVQKTLKWQLIFPRMQIAIISYPENPPPRWTERSARIFV